MRERHTPLRNPRDTGTSFRVERRLPSENSGAEITYAVWKKPSSAFLMNTGARVRF